MAAIHFIITNAAKYDVDDKSLILEVQQLGLPKENTDALAKQFRDTKDMLQAKFAEDSFRVSKLLQVDWRVDQIIASSSYPTHAETAQGDDVGGESAASNVNDVMTPSIHLSMKVDTKPFLDSAEASAEGSDQVQNVALELSSNQLDVLIHELSHAQKLLENIGN